MPKREVVISGLSSAMMIFKLDMYMCWFRMNKYWLIFYSGCKNYLQNRARRDDGNAAAMTFAQDGDIKAFMRSMTVMPTSA